MVAAAKLDDADALAGAVGVLGEAVSGGDGGGVEGCGGGGVGAFGGGCGMVAAGGGAVVEAEDGGYTHGEFFGDMDGAGDAAMSATVVIVADHFDVEGFAEIGGGPLKDNGVTDGRSFDDFKRVLAGEAVDAGKIVGMRAVAGFEVIAGEILAVAREACGESRVVVEGGGGAARSNHDGDGEVLKGVDGAQGFGAFERDVFTSLDGNVRVVRAAGGHRDTPRMLLWPRGTG